MKCSDDHGFLDDLKFIVVRGNFPNNNLPEPNSLKKLKENRNINTLNIRPQQAQGSFKKDSDEYFKYNTSMKKTKHNFQVKHKEIQCR